VWCHVLGEGAFCTTKVFARRLPFLAPSYCNWRGSEGAGSEGAGTSDSVETDRRNLDRRNLDLQTAVFSDGIA
jgi:hypothetical protein